MTIKKYIRLAKIYFKFNKAINDYYEFALGGMQGWTVPENLDWKERTQYWLDAD